MDTVKIIKGKTKLIAHRGLSGIETENTAAVYVDDAENDTIYRYLGDTKTYLDETISYITHSAPGKS